MNGEFTKTLKKGSSSRDSLKTLPVVCLLCFYRFSELPEAVLGDFLRNGRDMPSHRPLREGTLSWGGGRAGASEGRVISESEHQKGRAIPHVSYSREGHKSFPEFFNENFCDVAFHFSYRLSFYFHLL